MSRRRWFGSGSGSWPFGGSCSRGRAPLTLQPRPGATPVPGAATQANREPKPGPCGRDHGLEPLRARQGRGGGRAATTVTVTGGSSTTANARHPAAEPLPLDNTPPPGATQARVQRAAMLWGAVASCGARQEPVQSRGNGRGGQTGKPAQAHRPHRHSPAPGARDLGSLRGRAASHRQTALPRRQKLGRPTLGRARRPRSTHPPAPPTTSAPARPAPYLPLCPSNTWA